MTNGTKIKTMKDDLLEIENKLSYSSKNIQKEQIAQQQPAAKQTSSAPIKKPVTVLPSKSGISLPATKSYSKSDDLKTKELRSLVDRLAKKKTSPPPAAVKKPTDANAIQTSTAPKVVPKTSSSESEDLKALIARISKREGEKEKPLTKSATVIHKKTPIEPETEPQIKTATTNIESAKPEPDSIKPEQKVTEPEQKIAEPIATKPEPKIIEPETIKQPEIERPDLEKIIKPIEKPQEKTIEAPIVKPPEKTEPREEKPLARLAAVIHKKTPIEPETEQETRIKSKIKPEIEIQVKSKNTEPAIIKSEQKAAEPIAIKPEPDSIKPEQKVTEPEQKIAEPIATKPEPKIIEPETIKQPEIERPDLEKIIKPIEKPLEKTVEKPLTAEKGSELIEKTEEIKEILGDISKKENELKDLLEKMSQKQPDSVQPKQNSGSSRIEFPSSPKSIPIAKEKRKETPIMKKIRERMFGLEKEMNVSPENQVFETKPPTESAPENENKDYFKKIAESKQTIEPKLEKVEEKFSDLAAKDLQSELKPEKINEFENSSGIIKNDSKLDRKKEDELAKARRDYLDSQYVSPANRLVFEKQERYSAAQRHIEDRHVDANLEEMEKKVASDKSLHLSEKEIKKKLKERIMMKYHIKSPSTLRNILIVAVIIIAIAGGGLYSYLAGIDYDLPVIIPPPQPGKEIEKFASINDSLDINIGSLKNPITLKEETVDKFASDPNLKFFKLLIKDNRGNYVPLSDALGAIGIKKELLPQSFLDQTENEYSIIVFKTANNTTRLSLEIRIKPSNTMSSVMLGWEQDKVKMRDTLSPLFISDRSSDIQNKFFQAGSYKNVNLRFISLPDKNTAIDYFIYNNVLVIATGKDDAFKLIDILTSAG